MRTTLAVVGSITMLTSCISYYPVRPGEQPDPTSTVTVTFASPRDLEATYDTVVYALPAVEKVHAEMQHAIGDTLLLRVLRIESSQRQPELPAGARLAVAPDASTSIAMRGTSPGKTVGLLGLTLAGVIAVALIAFAADPGY
ncbi:MAG TPA: hypothetical protein VJ672_08675 [Gemmatimonadaceae bacterium]|nr:hypothetical protein [Gemmatimonadaceae bacterium]